MWRKIGVAGLALVVLCGLWLLCTSETATRRDKMLALPCELTWSVADVPISENSDIHAKFKTFVPIVGQLHGSQNWLWSHLCNVAVVGMYPDGILAPDALPADDREMLLEHLRDGSIPAAAMSDRTNVVRMFALCVPDGPSTPSTRSKLPIAGLSVAVGVEAESAFFAGLIEMPEKPGVYWVQLWCEFTTNDTFNSFTAFTGGPVAEVSITVTP